MQPQTQISPEDFDWLLGEYRKKPEDFITEVLGSKPWDKQTQIIQSAFDNKYTAVKTCNAVGKSYIAARIVITYLMLYPGSIVVTTAPTWRQVTDVLWREIGTAVKKAEQRGFKLTDKEVTQAGLNMDTDWFAVGLSTSRPENFFGYHADNILVVVDEAGGVDEAIFKGVAAITPNMGAHVLLIGNPTTPSGTFFDAFDKPELGYTCFTISAFDTPNFTMTGITNVQTLLDTYTAPVGQNQAQWIKQVDAELIKRMDETYSKSLISPSVVFGRYYEWGPDDPRWESLILGEFPSQAAQALIPTDMLRIAMRFNEKDFTTGRTFGELSGWKIKDGPNRYGQDMARFGGDKNVFSPRHGGWVRPQLEWGRKGKRVPGTNGAVDLMASADVILNQIDVDNPLVRVNIDDTGNGGGTTDRIHQKSAEKAAQGKVPFQFRLVPYNMSSKERMVNTLEFHDVTAEVYWNLRNWFWTGSIAFEQFDQELFDQLKDRRYFINKSGKIQVESKDEYIKRTKAHSPDKSDSLALAFAGEKPNGEYHDVQTDQDDYYRHLQEEAAAAAVSSLEPVMGGLSDRY
jgi:phage terminase large subunit